MLAAIVAMVMVVAMVPVAMAEDGAVTNWGIANWTTSSENKMNILHTDFEGNLSLIYKWYLSKDSYFDPFSYSGEDIEETYDFSTEVNEGDVLSLEVKGNSGTIGLENDEEIIINRPTLLILGTYSLGEYTLVSPIIVNRNLSLRSGDNNGGYSKLTIQQPITIENGATLLIDGSNNTGSYSNNNFNPDVFINAVEDESAIVVKAGGTLRIGAVELQNAADVTSQFITVEDGGTVIVQNGPTPSNGRNFVDGIPVLDNIYKDPACDEYETANVTSNTPIITASGDATIRVMGGEFTVTGDQPAIVLNENSTATLLLEGGTITTDAPIEVPAGATLEIPVGSTATVTTTAENEQAITLATGATVKMGDDTEITAGANSYVNNDGVVVLGAGSSVTQDGATTQMPNGGQVSSTGDVTVTPPYIPPVPSYLITLNDPDNGTVTADRTTARQGTEVTLTVTPEDGYALDGITVTDFFGNRVDVTRNSDGTYTFVMPYSQVTVSAAFVRTEAPIVFTDVDADDYFYNAVYWAVENGVTDGTSDTQSSPGRTVTRGEMVTFLWRAAGSPEPAATVNPFTDVDGDDYYYDAVLWAVENGITDGVSATEFDPDGECTRAQMVTFLWRAAGEPDAGTSNPFTDVDEEEYYYEAILWAAASGVTDGVSETTFEPGTVCTRAQAVTFLYRDRT